MVDMAGKFKGVGGISQIVHSMFEIGVHSMGRSRVESCY